MLAKAGLVRYLAPEDRELRHLAGINKSEGGGNKRSRRHQQQANNLGKGGDAFSDLDVFNVPRSIARITRSGAFSNIFMHLPLAGIFPWSWTRPR